MTALHLSTTQEDAIPFGVALGLSLCALAPATFRLWRWITLPKPRKWNLLICCISIIGSLSLSAIVFSKVFERHHGPYLGLILTNVVFVALYEVDCFRNFSALLHRSILTKLCTVGSVCIGVLMTVGFVLCFFKVVPLGFWACLIFAPTSGIYILLPLGYIHILVRSQSFALRRILWILSIPCPFVLLYSTTARRDRLVLPAWVFYIASNLCTIRFQIILFFSKPVSSSYFSTRSNDPAANSADATAAESNIDEPGPRHS